MTRTNRTAPKYILPKVLSRINGLFRIKKIWNESWKKICLWLFFVEWLERRAAGHWLGAKAFVLLPRRAWRPALVYICPCRSHGNAYGGGRWRRRGPARLWAGAGAVGVYMNTDLLEFHQVRTFMWFWFYTFGRFIKCPAATAWLVRVLLLLRLSPSTWRL